MALKEIWPGAPLFTAVYNPEAAPWAKVFEIKTSFLQKLPLAKRQHEWFAWLTPFAFSTLNFDKFNVVISVTSAEAKGINISKGTLHICYCLTPTRYLWSGRKLYEKDGIKGIGLKILGPVLRQWDYQAGRRPDIMIAISKTVKKRIKKYYHRESQIIYPSVDTNKFWPKDKKQDQPSVPFNNYYLVVSRLVAYKRIDLAVQAFNSLKKKLVIIGEGEEKERLQKIARENIYFVGQLTDEELLSYYQSCRALIFPGKEDFGLVSLEAQATGKPVIAYNKGGIAETLIHGKTGWLYSKPTPKTLISAVKSFERRKFKSRSCREQAKKFDQKQFQLRFKQLVEAEWKKFQLK